MKSFIDKKNLTILVSKKRYVTMIYLTFSVLLVSFIMSHTFSPQSSYFLFPFIHLVTLLWMWPC